MCFFFKRARFAVSRLYDLAKNQISVMTELLLNYEIVKELHCDCNNTVIL